MRVILNGNEIMELETKVDVNFQFLSNIPKNQVTLPCVILSALWLYLISLSLGTISQVNHIDGRIVNEPSELNQEEVEKPWLPYVWMLSILTFTKCEISLETYQEFFWSSNEILAVYRFLCLSQWRDLAKRRLVCLGYSCQYWWWGICRRHQSVCWGILPQKMAQVFELQDHSTKYCLKSEDLYSSLKERGYTHALGLSISSGISGFYQNIQYMVCDYEVNTIASRHFDYKCSPRHHLVERL